MMYVSQTGGTLPVQHMQALTNSDALTSALAEHDTMGKHKGPSLVMQEWDSHHFMQLLGVKYTIDKSMHVHAGTI